MTEKSKLETARDLVWDYDARAEELLNVLEGRREKVAGLNADALFRRMLKRDPWHIIVGMLGIDEVRRRLTSENIGGISPASLRERYERVRRLLRGEAVPAAGWGAQDARQGLRAELRARTYSHRWYRAQ